MTRSIFDPEGGQTEHSGNRYMGPSADNDSHMPPDVVDGKVSDEEAEENSPGQTPVAQENEEWKSKT